MISQPSLSLLQRLDRDVELTSDAPNAELPEGQFLGIIGLAIVPEVWDAMGALRLQPINPRSGPHEIARVMNDDRLGSILARYSEYVGYELVVSKEVASDEGAIELGRSFISLLRVRALPDILVPAALPRSWSATVLNRLPARSCPAYLVEDIPTLLQLDERKFVTESELDWVFDNLSGFRVQYETIPSYRLAVDSLCQHNHQSNLRMAATMLWSGIEAFFPIRGEIAHKLALYCTTFLEGPGLNRYDLFKEIKVQYNTRSRIVHGDMAENDAITSHVRWTRQLLSRLICKATENRGIPDPAGLERHLFESATQMAYGGEIDRPRSAQSQ